MYKEVKWLNLVVFMGIFYSLYLAGKLIGLTAGLTILAQLQWVLPLTLILSGLCVFVFNDGNDYQLRAVRSPSGLALFLCSVVACSAAFLLNETMPPVTNLAAQNWVKSSQHYILALSGVLGFLALFLPFREVRKGEYLILDGQVKKPGKKFRLWGTPLLNYPIQVVPTTLQVKDRLYLHFNGGANMQDIWVSYDLQLMVSEPADPDKHLDPEQIETECKVWVAGLLQQMSPNFPDIAAMTKGLKDKPIAHFFGVPGYVNVMASWDSKFGFVSAA